MHAILDNLQVHKTPEVKQWLDAHPRWTFHFTPTHASWLNEIELFFSILTRRLLRRGIFTSQTDLREQLLGFIDRYNPTAKPFAGRRRDLVELQTDRRGWRWRLEFGGRGRWRCRTAGRQQP